MANNETILAFQEVLNECLELFKKKSQDYGPAPIARLGEAGLLVRLIDKVERLYNLHTRATTPQNESVEDTLKDIVNYAILFLLVRRGVLKTKKVRLVEEVEE